MKTEEENKLIADFMGHYHIQDNYYRVTRMNCYHLNQLQYHSSWDWLMPVVDKIEDLKESNINYPKLIINRFNNNTLQLWGANFMDRYEKAFYGKGAFQVESKIIAVWQACVNFINWYNEKAIGMKKQIE